LNAGDPNADSSDGHPIAYEVILRESQTYEHPPIFLKEDSDHVVNDEFLAEKVQGWMAISQQVATGSHKRVLEDGIDVWDSSDEDDPKMEPDTLTGMYTAGMDPQQGPVKLTTRQVAVQKAVASASRPPKSEPVSERQPTPLSPDTEDQTKGTVVHEDLVAGAKARLAVPRCPSAGASLPPKEEGRPVTRSRAVTDPSPSDTDTMKKASIGTADVPQPTKEQQAPKKPVKGQESPEVKASHPMSTRKRASGAGSLRPGGSSGQADTCVAQGNHSKT
jgi:hypothetical protein